MGEPAMDTTTSFGGHYHFFFMGHYLFFTNGRLGVLGLLQTSLQRHLRGEMLRSRPPPQLPRKLRRLSGPIPLSAPTTGLTQCWRRVDSTAGQAARHLLAGTLSNKWETWCSRIITDKPPKTSSWRNAAEPPPPQLPRKLRRLSGPIPLSAPTTGLTQCWRRVDST